MQILTEKGMLNVYSSIKLRDFGKLWFSEILPLRGLKPSSLSNYQQMANFYIYPTLGTQQLDSIRPTDILDWVNSLRLSGLSTNTIRRARSILLNMLESAVGQDILNRNPVTSSSAVRKVEGETSQVKKSYSAAEVLMALEALSQTSYEGPFRLMVFLGLRIGEVIGLKWDQVSFDTNQIWIVQTEGNIPVLNSDGTWKYQRVSGSTKSGRKRVLQLSESQAVFLKKHRKEQSRTRFSHGQNWNPDNYVFVTSNGTPFAANNVRKGIKSVLSKHGIRVIRLHDLRHTAGFLAAEAGISVNDIQDMLGHSNIAITKNIYIGHVQAGSDRAVFGLEKHILNLAPGEVQMRNIPN